jgi:hypothetical protein
LKKITDDAASRVEKVMKKSEEQAIMIESLHRSVAMYRKLCEEQQKTRSNVESVPNNLQGLFYYAFFNLICADIIWMAIIFVWG